MAAPEDDPRLRSARLHSDVERLRAQVALSWPKELALLRALGLVDGMSILDLGLGPGFFASRLLETFPASLVAGVDLDRAMIEAATQLLACWGDRCLLVHASAAATLLPEETFDFAIARFLFQHLHAPELVAGEVFELLKPGGRFVVIDIDEAASGFVAPAFPALDVVNRRVAHMQFVSAGNRCVGRTLWRLLAEAGFTDLSLDAIVVHSDELGIEPLLPQYDPDRYLPFVVPGGLSQAEWDAYEQAFDEYFLADPPPYVLQVLLAVSGVRPVG